MSGIFKGDSIYKNGGGGGGYKDGGELVDGDFIKVENNAVSTYDNESRDPVNFYFELKEGEILNSVVELTTDVNSTVYVYVVKNGIYYLLGNVGGNTVNAGENYNVNVTGDSYSIDEVSSEPEMAFGDVDGVIYPIKKINNLVWVTEDYKEPISGVNSRVSGGFRYYRNGDFSHLNINGWRLPTSAEISSLKSYLGGGASASIAVRATSSWNDGLGTNSSGLNILSNGAGSLSGSNFTVNGVGEYSWHKMDGDGYTSWKVVPDNITTINNLNLSTFVGIRLVKTL